MRHLLDYLNAFPMSYDEYVEEMLDIYTPPHSTMNTVSVCNELNAFVEERAIYKDVKLFSRSGKFYRPTEIIATPHRIRPQFLGLRHVRITGSYKGNMTISPMETIRLISILESFVGNLLVLGKTYKAGAATCSIVKRKDAMYLNIDYNHREYEQSYLDKCNCKITINILRTITHNSDFWFYD